MTVLSDPGLSDPGLSDPGLSDPVLAHPVPLARLLARWQDLRRAGYRPPRSDAVTRDRASSLVARRCGTPWEPDPTWLAAVRLAGVDPERFDDAGTGLRTLLRQAVSARLSEPVEDAADGPAGRAWRAAGSSCGLDPGPGGHADQPVLERLGGLLGSLTRPQAGWLAACHLAVPECHQVLLARLRGHGLLHGLAVPSTATLLRGTLLGSHLAPGGDLDLVLSDWAAAAAVLLARPQRLTIGQRRAFVRLTGSALPDDWHAPVPADGHICRSNG